MDFIIGTKMNFPLSNTIFDLLYVFPGLFLSLLFLIIQNENHIFAWFFCSPGEQRSLKTEKKAFVHFQLHDCVLVYKPTNVHAFQFILYNGEG